MIKWEDETLEWIFYSLLYECPETIQEVHRRDEKWPELHIWMYVIDLEFDLLQIQVWLLCEKCIDCFMYLKWLYACPPY